MFCKQCGNELPDDSSFCFHCGAALANGQPASDAKQIYEGSLAATPTATQAAPSEGLTSPHHSNVKKKSTAAVVFAAVSLLLAAALTLSLFGVLPSPFAAASASAVSSQSFDTPEAAIESFVGYMKAGDYKGILRTCAINTMAQSFDYKVYSELHEGISPMYYGYLPSDYPDYVAYNKYKLTKEILSDIYNFVISLKLPIEYSEITYNSIFVINEDSFPDNIIEDMAPAKISELNMIDIEKNELKNGDDYLRKRKEEADVFGAEDIQRRTVLFEYEDRYYICGFTLIQYDGRWQVQNLSDEYSGISFDRPTQLGDKSGFYAIFKEINS